jgi:PBP4 family serine-type D-alanyl-D-alanine carboxypeptidase
VDDTSLQARNMTEVPTEPAPPSLHETIAQITAQDRYSHSTWSFHVRDRGTGDVVFDHNGELLFVTGSILKVFSTAAALDAYGPEYRFRTPVYRTGDVRRGVLRGDLVLVASGDLSLGLRERPDGTLVFDNAPAVDHTYANSGLPGGVPVAGDPLAGLDSLAQQVAESGIERVRGELVIDDRLFSTFFGWPAAARSPMTPIWVNENRIDITSTPTEVGQPAQVDYRPKTAAYTVRTAVQTVSAGGETTIEVSLPEPGVFLVSGTIAADAGPTLRVGEIPDPTAFARTAFIEALERAGVEVGAAPTGRNPSDRLPPAGSYAAEARVAEHVSGTLAEFTKVILKTSHNPGADLMACLVGVAAGSRDCTAGLVAAANYVRRLGIADGSIYIFDGAGSDERDHATGSAMTAYLRALDEQPIGSAFQRSLAVLGVDGDLAQTERDSPAGGQVQAKTGTRGATSPAGVGLMTTRTLVGYVNAKSGRHLVISVMVRDIPFTSVNDLFAVVADAGKITAAIQQAY